MRRFDALLSASFAFPLEGALREGVLWRNGRPLPPSGCSSRTAKVWPINTTLTENRLRDACWKPPCRCTHMAGPAAKLAHLQLEARRSLGGNAA
ncbi:hypothetical protein KCP74_12655 [Salmonella enterica subsp. enterica]|nr:hypothetical protein KCP74_12655 [Salmonella enterica subsp. enterica]